MRTQRRLQRSLLPHAGALRRAPQRPDRLCARRHWKARRSRCVAGTAHEAYLKMLFTEAPLQPYPNDDAAHFALKRGEVDLLLGDGISLAFWLNGTDSANSSPSLPSKVER